MKTMLCLCLFGLLAIVRSHGIEEDRLQRLETKVQQLTEAVKILAASSVQSKPHVEETLMEHAQPSFVHRRKLETKPYEATKLKREEYSGVALEKEKSKVSFGPKGDVYFARTGDGKLIVQAKHIDFQSAVAVKGELLGKGIGSDVIDSLEGSIQDIQKELGILSKAVAENTKNSLCNKKRDILVGYMKKGSTAHQKSGAVAGIKLSDTEINTIRGNFASSVLKVTCGKCTVYVKQNRAFAAKGYTSANNKLSVCSASPNGPFKDYGYSGHNLHFGIDCWNLPQGIVYEDNNAGGCNCKLQGRSDGTLTVLNAQYCNEVKP